jgi:hypothetical protein
MVFISVAVISYNVVDVGSKMINNFNSGSSLLLPALRRLRFNAFSSSLIVAPFF